MPRYGMQATATFTRGMKDALKLPSNGLPEYELIAEILEHGISLTPGRNVEKLYERNGIAVYSARIDQGRRMTFQLIGQKVLFRCVGEHDTTYRKDREL